MKQSEVNVIKHTYEYLPYNNWTTTRLATEVVCNNICYMTTNYSVGTDNLRVSSSIRISKCIRMHHINRILLEVAI
jgi:hypothetical protein